MAQIITSAKDVIEKLGGDESVAPMFEVTKKAVSNWRVANRFPGHTFLKITDELRRVGAEADHALFAFERAKRSQNVAQTERAQ